MTKLKKAEAAHKLYEKILELQYYVVNDVLAIGKCFRVMRDKLAFKDLGYDTFPEFMAHPEIHFAPSTIYGYMQVSEKCEQLGITSEEASPIGIRRVRMILPFITSENKDEWLGKAQALSNSDFINEVNKARGKPPMLKNKKSSPNLPPPSPSYKKYVEEYDRCCACGKRKATGHHFPQRRRRTDNMNKMIPLCGECHNETEYREKDWLWENRVKIFDYLYKAPSIEDEK